MKRRSLRPTGSFGLYALSICLSTIALQALTAPYLVPFSWFRSILNPMDSILWNRMTSASKTFEIHRQDLQLHNLSVHRIRYVDEKVAVGEQDPVAATSSTTCTIKTLTDFLTTVTSRRYLKEVSSVVVTWEEHVLAVRARANSDNSDDAAGDSVSESYSYEVQVWVTGWGLDSLWNAANRKIITWDPFLVLVDLPLDHEMGFRVRMKAKQTKNSVFSFLFPMELFSRETNGEWSEVAILSPTRDDELEAIVTSLASNKLLVLLLIVCIGSGCLVVARLYYRRRFTGIQRPKLFTMRRSSLQKDHTVMKTSCAAATGVNIDSSDKSKQQLEREICNLRQELADSEDEVRRLMLLSGYGIEMLVPHELEQLEYELKCTLKRIHHLKKHGPTLDMEASSSIKGKSLVS